MDILSVSMPVGFWKDLSYMLGDESMRMESWLRDNDVDPDDLTGLSESDLRDFEPYLASYATTLSALTIISQKIAEHDQTVPADWRYPNCGFTGWSLVPGEMYARTIVTVDGSEYAKIYRDHDAPEGSDRQFIVYIRGADLSCPWGYSPDYCFTGSAADVAHALANWAGQ